MDIDTQLDVLMKASQCKCKLSQEDIDEAAEVEHLVKYIQDVYNALAAAYGVSKIKYWRLTHDGIRVVLVDGTVENIDYLNGVLIKE